MANARACLYRCNKEVIKKMSKTMRWCLLGLGMLITLGTPLGVWAQEAAASPPAGMEMTLPVPVEGSAAPSSLQPAPDLIKQILVLLLLALAPYIVMVLTSFTKTVIVMSLLRNALGLQQTPPTQVLIAVSLVIAFYVMAPVGMKIYDNVHAIIHRPQDKTELLSANTASMIAEIVIGSEEPLREFLIHNTSSQHQKLFYKLAKKNIPEALSANISMNDFLIVIPSFITSQINDAFQIGVLIYLPFFVIDIVTSNVLLAMGMMMLSPMTISLPLKLLLLVMLDGWTLLIQGLILSFK